MKIINIKFSFKLFIIIFSVTIILLSSIFLIKLFDNTIVMTNDNYTDILKSVHDNIDDYVDKKITTTGYVFRMSDFTDKQFVTARDMIINESDYRIVGFLCEYDKIKDFENNSWIKIKGTIKLKDYHGPMPVIEVTEITKISIPNESAVFLPKQKTNEE